MKYPLYLCAALLLLSLGSCVAPRYYQEYKVAPGKDITAGKQELVFENEHVRITYNFWGEGGDAGVLIRNKTSNDLIVQKDECFFILNGMAYDYYRGRILTSSSTTGRSATAVGLSGKSGRGKASSAHWSATSEESFQEQREMVIPAGTSKRMAEYSVNSELFRSCDMPRYPSSRKNPSKTFTETNSPFRFANHIVYSVGAGDEQYWVRNDFHVAAITNYNGRAYTKSMEEEFCGSRTGKLVTAFPMAGPDKFYIGYYKIAKSSGKY